MKKRQLDAIKRMNTILSFVLSLSIVFLFSLQPLKAQVPPPPPLPDSGSSAGNGVTPGEPIYGKVDGTPLSQAHPEDITNENFPDKIDSFDYPNADISDVIKAISRLTGKNFIIEQGVKGKITIVAPTQITVAEAYRAFLSALASLNYTVVPAGKFLKIKNSRAAQRDSIETYAGEYFPNTDQMITRIIKLKYISATEVDKQLRTLPTKDGEMRPYEPTNSLIVTDYGSNIERIMKIIKELDVPGFEEQLAVIQIYHAKAKNISDLIDQIINKDNKKNNSRFSSSRFNRNNNNDPGGSESYSLVTADERTNSIIVVGNEIGVKKIRGLVKKLDFKLRLEDSGGVYVYPVRFGDAEEMAKTLGGIAKQDATTKTKTPTTNNRQEAAPAPPKPIFGGDVNITADKQTNSLIITASRQDYLVVKNLLSKIDVSRDQVFVKVIIM
ncbi:MAG: type II secretion system protein GspD, partial [Bdellovibrionales bacterium]|nr:type II secretion system protein GspD [Bdellovibrionales bacterium]